MSTHLVHPVLLGLVSAALTLIPACSRQSAPEALDTHSSRNRINRELLAQLAALENQERLLNETVWAKEIMAQEHGRIFDDLWDAINQATNRLRVLTALAPDQVVLGHWSETEHLPFGIEVRKSAGPGSALSVAEWQRFVEGHEADGWQLGELEIRHERFDVDEAGLAQQSHFYFAAHLTHPQREQRAVIEGDLRVEWDSTKPEKQLFPIRLIDTRQLLVKSRRGPPPFHQLLIGPISSPEHGESIDPLILYDLDADGLSEIVLPGKNLVYHRRTDGQYQPEPLCRFPPDVVYTALVADFDSDGTADLLCGTSKGLLLFAGTAQGTFDLPAQMAFPAPSDWSHPMVLTGGDIDSDGDLDLFLGQYKAPYQGGQIPTPYYDANDGHPAYLLLNRGGGRFDDATRPAGLEPKRHRRTYSASLVDVDDDADLDLVVISDFAGADLYRNDGRGHFTELTPNWIRDPKAFGMSHALADFNADGRLDLLMIGMTSPTVDRLAHFDLWRSAFPEDRTMPSRMMHGNRLYLARDTGGFEETALGHSLARSGWSWGCAALDIDNDGYPDVYVTNGLESRSSVRDYEPEYWLHDRFVAGSLPNPAAYLYFQSKFNRTRDRGYSYGGYERNRLFLNRQARSFVDLAHLMGAGFQEDARNAVADDLDGDGRIDLALISFEPWPNPRQTLRLLHNRLTQTGAWVGFRFQEQTSSPSPLGARVSLRYSGRTVTRSIVSGDSHRSQHATFLHFGLGETKHLDSAEIRWPSGATVRLLEPALNRYHSVTAPTQDR